MKTEEFTKKIEQARELNKQNRHEEAEQILLSLFDDQTFEEYLELNLDALMMHAESWRRQGNFKTSIDIAEQAMVIANSLPGEWARNQEKQIRELIELNLHDIKAQS